MIYCMSFSFENSFQQYLTTKIFNHEAFNFACAANQMSIQRMTKIKDNLDDFI